MINKIKTEIELPYKMTCRKRPNSDKETNKIYIRTLAIVKLCEKLSERYRSILRKMDFIVFIEK